MAAAAAERRKRAEARASSAAASKVAAVVRGWLHRRRQRRSQLQLFDKRLKDIARVRQILPKGTPLPLAALGLLSRTLLAGMAGMPSPSSSSSSSSCSFYDDDGGGGDGDAAKAQRALLLKIRATLSLVQSSLSGPAAPQPAGGPSSSPLAAADAPTRRALAGLAALSRGSVK